MGVALFGLVGLAYMLSLIAACAYFSRMLMRRTRSRAIGVVAFILLMLAMWCDTAYQHWILKPALCTSPDAQAKVFATVKLPPEYYRPDGGMSDLFKLGSSSDRQRPPDSYLMGRYFMANEYARVGSNSFTRYERNTTGIWDHQEKRWMSVVNFYSLDGGYWWAWPLGLLPDADWALSRLSSSNACSARLASYGIDGVFGFR